MNEQIINLNNIIKEEIKRVESYKESSGYVNIISQFINEVEVSEEEFENISANFYQFKIDENITQEDELVKVLSAYNEIYERMLKTDLSDKFSEMSDFEILVYIKELNNQLIKLALKEPEYLDIVIHLSNEINYIYKAFESQDDMYFHDNMKFILRPLINTISNFDCEIENFSDQILEERVEYFLKTYLVFAQDQASNVKMITNELGFEQLSYEQKLDKVSEMIDEYEEFRNIFLKLKEDNNREELIIFMEDFLLTDLLIGSQEN